MRISDWSSDVCSSDLDPRSPPTGSLGESGRAQPRSTAAIRCRNDNFTGLKNGSEGPMKLTDVRSTALGLSVAALSAGSAAVAQAQETFITIGTGGQNGVDYQGDRKRTRLNYSTN